MVLLVTLFVCALVVAPYLVAAEKPSEADLDVLRWKFDVLIRESKLTADAVKKINIRTPACKIQLANILTAYLHDLSYALYSFNVAVPNLINSNGYPTLVNATKVLNTFMNDLQDLVYQDSESAKNGLYSVIDSIESLLTPFIGRISVPNDFASKEFNHVFNLFIYGLFKVKIQALYFEDTNKQLVGRITDGINELSDEVNKFSSTNPKALEEYRRLCVLLQIITERIVNRLENWIEINSKDTKGVKIAEEVIGNMRNNYGRLTHALTDLQTLSELKAELASIYVSGATKVQKLAQIEYPENTGGQEYIRTTLVDGIVIPKAFGENIRSNPFKP